jgi:hypothetical protein
MPARTAEVLLAFRKSKARPQLNVALGGHPYGGVFGVGVEDTLPQRPKRAAL